MAYVQRNRQSQAIKALDVNDASTSSDLLDSLSLPEFNEFESDDEEDWFSTADIKFPFGDLNDDPVEPPKKTPESRKNKRKTMTPQRAIPSKSISNGDKKHKDLDMSDNEVDNEQCIDEEKFYTQLQEQAEGLNLDEEVMDTVKEEFRSNWGIKCGNCQQIFSYKSEFDQHYKDSYDKTPVYSCTFCDKTTEQYRTFQIHIYRHITDEKHKCKECDRAFSLRSMLHFHIIAKHTKTKPFSCDECDKSFVTKPGLRVHLKKHNSDVKEEYPCVLCGKILHTRGGLTSHLNVHRLGRRFMCDICGKTFTQKVNMQQHAKQHTGDKPYACDKCDKSFSEKCHLARHYSYHSNDRPFKCNVCSKMYKTERCLKVHSMVHSEARPFVCTYCNKGFLSSTKLKQHYNIHTGERPYACKYCERKFTNYPNWLKHTRRRHRVDHKTGEQLEDVPTKASTKTAIKKETSGKLAPVQQQIYEVEYRNVPSGIPQEIPNNTTNTIPDIPTGINLQTVNSAVQQLSLPVVPEVPNLDLDLNLLKTEDLFLQTPQNVMSVVMDTDKLYQMQPDLFNGAVDNTFLMSHFPNPMTTPTQQVMLPNTMMFPASQQMPMQFTDFVNTPLLHLPCDSL